MKDHKMAEIQQWAITQQQWDDLFKWVESSMIVGEVIGRSLMEDEVKYAEEVGVEDIARVRVVIVDAMRHPPKSLQQLSDLFLKPQNAAGLTLGHVIFIQEGQYRFTLLKHELRHVYQVEQHEDWKAFLINYVSQVTTYGYENAPLELDAKKFG
jgi:hypothetical protein